MLDTLKFVQGAVAKKDFVPALNHFLLKNNRVTGFNGSLAISAPVNIDFQSGVAPKANQFVKAISACTERITLHVAENGKLVVKSGAFKMMVDCIDPTSYPEIKPGGKIIKITQSLLPALTYLEPFIAEDASRPWACGILFDGQSAFATNNIVLLEYWLGFDFPCRINIPGAAVKELIRIGEDPTEIQMTENRIVFHYEDGKWLSTQTLESQWPDVGALLNRHAGVEVHEFPAGFWEAIDQIIPFTDELSKCYFMGEKLGTGSNTEKEGASVQISCPSTGIFNAKQLRNLKGIADKIGFEAYPNPVPFYGDKTRGIIVGIRS